MRWIREACGREIAEAAEGDPIRSALLAAITANESGGSRQAYRFAPANYERLLGLLAGNETKVDGVTRAQLEKRLNAVKKESDRALLLKQLAGLHGYTGLPGYLSIVWKEPLEALTEKDRHFQLAAQRLEDVCRQFELDPAKHAAEIGRCWNAGCPNGRMRLAMYSWRLQERIRLYVGNLTGLPGAHC